MFQLQEPVYAKIISYKRKFCIRIEEKNEFCQKIAEKNTHSANKLH